MVRVALGGQEWVWSCVALGLSCQLWGGQRTELLKVSIKGAPPAQLYILKHHRGAHMPELWGGVGGSPAWEEWGHSR